jgi:hypothetical protein
MGYLLTEDVRPNFTELREETDKHSAKTVFESISYPPMT